MPGHEHAALHSLDALEYVEHLPLTDSAIVVGIELLGSHPHLLVVHRRSHPHPQAQVPVGVEELHTLQLSTSIEVVLHEDVLDVVPEHLVVDVVVPPGRVVDVVEAVHGVVVHAGVSPSVEGVAMVPMSMVSMVPVVVSVTVSDASMASVSSLT